MCVDTSFTQVVCYQPGNTEKLGYWLTLCKAIAAVCPGVRVITATLDLRLAAVKTVTGRNITGERHSRLLHVSCSLLWATVYCQPFPVNSDCMLALAAAEWKVQVASEDSSRCSCTGVYCLGRVEG